MVVNQNSEASLAVANCFIHLRNIPAANVVYIDFATNRKGKSRDADSFRKKVLNSVFEHMDRHRIANQITCITWSTGFPTSFSCKRQLATFQKFAPSANGKAYSPACSLTSMTYFSHEDFFSDKPTFFGLRSNRYAGAQVGSLLSNPFEGESSAQYNQGLKLLAAGEPLEAHSIFEKLSNDHPRQSSVRYLLAKCLAEGQQTENATEALWQARLYGWSFPDYTSNDPSFASIKNDQLFKRIIGSMIPVAKGSLPPRPFNPGSYWSRNGYANGSADGTAGEGKRYFLSTVLSVVGPEALSTEEAIEQLESSVAADGTFPKGDFYISVHRDRRTNCRRPDLNTAARELKANGFSALLGSQRRPTGRKDIVGATLGSREVGWIEGGNRFLPGSLCGNLTSHGARWHKKQTLLTEFLRAGAAGASGTVTEPLAIPQKFPNSRLHVNYTQGSNLAEAFYQSVHGPFQLLVVGDPLCRPYAKTPKFSIDGIRDNEVLNNGPLNLKIRIEKGSPPIRRFEYFVDGKYQKDLTQLKFQVATDGLHGGYHEIRVVGVCDSPTEARKSEVVGFELSKNSLPIKLTATQNSYELSDQIEFKVEPRSNFDLVHNSRVVGKIINGTGSVSATSLGPGTVGLQARQPDGMIASKPVFLKIGVQ